MKRLLAVLLLCSSSVSAFAQWQPAGATSGPISYTGGNVGVNTATPTESLHVSGNTKVGGAIKYGHTMISGNWWNSGGPHTGYVKLVTPIVYNESNMFTIGITAYRYWGVPQPIQIRCNGYAYLNNNVFTNHHCLTEGTDLPVEIATEVRGTSPDPVVVIRIGAPDTVWYYGHFRFDYTGWIEKAPGGFTWVRGETTPVIGTNMNNVFTNDMAGTLAIGATQLAGTRLTVGGNSYFADHVGIGIAPHTTYALSTVGGANTTSFAGNPLTAILTSNNAHTVANSGSGIGFGAVYNAAGGTAVIGVVSAVKESTVDGDYAGALTFGTRAAGSSTGSMERMRIKSSGEVVIGQTGNTGTKLTVNGDIVGKGSISGVRVFNAVYQDIAEWVPASEDMAPGTVVVLSPQKNNEVMPSGRPYDTTVAGVVSEQPGVLLGVGDASKEQIATTGRVRVRVDATAAPIAIGDLLVTSGTAGTAMKSIPLALGDTQIHRPGTIIGKALEPLASGTGEILVLLSLQ